MYNKPSYYTFILYVGHISKYIMYAITVLKLSYNNIMLSDKKQYYSIKKCITLLKSDKIT